MDTIDDLIAWCNGLTNFIAGFFHWLTLEIAALFTAAGNFLQDMMFRIADSAFGFFLSTLQGSGMSTGNTNISSLIQQLPPQVSDTVLALNFPAQLGFLMTVVIFKWVLRLIPLPWRA